MQLGFCPILSLMIFSISFEQMEEQQLSCNHFILVLRKSLTGQTETSHGKCCLAPEQSWQITWRVHPAPCPAPTAANQRCLGKEHRYGTCIGWFVVPPGCPTLISHPKHLWFKVSLSQKTTLSFNFLQWILIFLDYLLTLWVLIKFCHLHPWQRNSQINCVEKN